MTETRRGFLARVFGGAAAAFCAPFVVKALPATPKLMFHRDAFAFTMAPLTALTADEFKERYLAPAVKYLIDEDERRMIVSGIGYVTPRG